MYFQGGDELNFIKWPAIILDRKRIVIDWKNNLMFFYCVVQKLVYNTFFFQITGFLLVVPIHFLL